MPIGGPDLVFGVEWLKSLGPILIDYNSLTMSFTQNGLPIELKGSIGLGPKEITHQQVKRLLKTHRGAAFFHIQSDSTFNPETETLPHPHTASYPAHLQPLLTKYAPLFQPPTSIPPPCPTDHSIHLLPNSEPVNVKPYRYPYFQKHEIEKQVEEMLSKGMIQPSRSPFSSPFW